MAHLNDAPDHSSNSYTNGGAGVDATDIRAQELNMCIWEIINAVTGAGISLNPSTEATGPAGDMTQLKEAILLYAAGTLYGDSGAPDSYIITTGATSLVDGMTFAIRIAHGNTGASSLNADALGDYPIKWPNGDALSLADTLKQDSIIVVRWDDDQGWWQLMTPSWENVVNSVAEVIAARGNLASLVARLNVSTDADGELTPAGLNEALSYATIGVGPTYTITLTDHHNVASITRTGAGTYRVAFTASIAGATTWPVFVTPEETGNERVSSHILAKNTAYVDVLFRGDLAGGLFDPDGFSFMVPKVA
jgi:hypothetical protein